MHVPENSYNLLHFTAHAVHGPRESMKIILDGYNPLKAFHTFGLFIGGDITSIEFHCLCYYFLIAKAVKPNAM